MQILKQLVFENILSQIEKSNFTFEIAFISKKSKFLEAMCSRT